MNSGYSGYIEALRSAARGVIGKGAFLKRDRGDALYVTDAPLRCPGLDAAARAAGAGFVCRRRGDLLYFTPGPAWLGKLEAVCAEPPDDFCRSLLPFRGLKADRESLALFAMGLKALAVPGERERFRRQLGRRAAVCLRQRGMGVATDRQGGGLYACGIVNHMTEEAD